MKSRASLQLMELLMMVLVFSLAAALCLEVFARAGEISGETERRDRAVALAADAAEILKATDGDLSAAEAVSREGYRVTVIPGRTRQPGLSEAEIQVFFEEELLFSLNTGWQEVLP